MSCKRVLLAAAAVLPLAGCASIDPQTGSPDPRFSEATRWNAAAQIIDPDPVYADNSDQPGASGVKAAGAAERYRTDRVKEPRVQTTTTGNTGGAGAGQGPGPR